jgi:hypothetical protein
MGTILSPLDFEQAVRSAHASTENALRVLDTVWDPIGGVWAPLRQPIEDGGSLIVSGAVQADSYVWNGKAWVEMAQPIEDGGSVDVTTVPATDLTKTAAVLLAWTALAGAAWGKTPAFDVSSKLAALIEIEFSLTAGAAPTATTFYLEGSAVDSGDEAWVPLGTDYTFTTGTTAAQTSGVDGTVKAGDTTVAESATGTLAAGDQVCFVNTTPTNSEISRVVSVVANTSFTLLDGLTRAQTGATWYSKAERFCALLMLDGIKRLRVVCAAGSQNILWRVLATTADSIG